jgi:hypothetical protein
MTSGELLLREGIVTAAAGIAIAAACGLRAFLPLLALAIGVRTHMIEVDPAAAWIANTPVMVALVWATVIELAADKVPPLDHFLDLVAMVLRPAAAGIAAWCTFRRSIRDRDRGCACAG